MISCCPSMENSQCLVTHNGRVGPGGGRPQGEGGHASPQTLPVPLEVTEPRAGGSGSQALCKVLYP